MLVLRWFLPRPLRNRRSAVQQQQGQSASTATKQPQHQATPPMAAVHDHMPANATATQAAQSPPPPQLDKIGVSDLNWATLNGEQVEKISTSSALPRREEVVFLKPAPENSGYLVYSLDESSSTVEKETKDGNEKPFALKVCHAQELPWLNRTDGVGNDDEELLLDGPPAHLKAHQDRDLHVVVSTRSGLRHAEAFWEWVLGPLFAVLGIQGVNVLVTQSDKSIREFARSLRRGQEGEKKKGKEATVVLLSGDGGVVDLLNGMGDPHPEEETQPPTVAILPLGTGNALFHSLHRARYTPAKSDTPIPSPAVLGLRTLFRGRTAVLPTFRADFSSGSRLVPTASADATQGDQVSHLVGAIVASYGFHASLVWESDTPAYRIHGDKRFGMAAGELLKISHAYNADVDAKLTSTTTSALDGNEPTHLWGSATGHKPSYVLATLVSNLEKTFTISPASKPLDSSLRLIHFGDVGEKRTMEIMRAAYAGGKHVGMTWGDGPADRLGYDEVDEVCVTVREEDARWRKVCIDGTIVEVPLGGWIRVRAQTADKARLRVLIDGV